MTCYQTHNQLSLGLLSLLLVLLSLHASEDLAVGGAVLHGEVTQQLAKGIHLYEDIESSQAQQ